MILTSCPPAYSCSSPCPQVSRLSDMTGLTEDVAGVSDKVAQQKAKLVDMEASVTQQERSTAKVNEKYVQFEVILHRSCRKT